MLCELPSEIVLRPAANAAFALLDGRPVLFSETAQKLFELDQIGALIWCKLAQDASSLDDIYRELEGRGIDEPSARQFTRQAIDEWIDRALLNFEWRTSTDCELSANLGRRGITVRAANGALLDELAPLFCASDRGTVENEIFVDIIEFDGQVFFRGEDACIHRCQAERFVPAVKAYVTERIIQGDRSAFALHAASLARGRMGLLLCGQPGAGKSTLTLQLMDAGFEYAGDDVALINTDGTVCGVPFPVTVKSGSWELLSGLHADLPRLKTYCRPDGALVRYVPAPGVHEGNLLVDWIVFLNRVPNGSAELAQLDQCDSMRRLIESSFAVDGKLSLPGFAALKRIVTHASSFELTYSESTQARRLLTDLCDGRT